MEPKGGGNVADKLAWICTTENEQRTSFIQSKR